MIHEAANGICRDCEKAIHPDDTYGVFLGSDDAIAAYEEIFCVDTIPALCEDCAQNRQDTVTATIVAKRG